MKRMHAKALKESILQTVLAAEVSKGHLKWKVSDIARHANISRPLIYYHFGKTKKLILMTCLQLIAEDYFGLNEERTALVEAGGLAESLKLTRQMYLNNPALAIFYLTFRSKKSQINTELQVIEKRYQARLSRLFPNLNSSEIQAVHAIFHGLITAPFLNQEGLEAAIQMIKSKANLNRD